MVDIEVHHFQYTLYWLHYNELHSRWVCGRAKRDCSILTFRKSAIVLDSIVYKYFRETKLTSGEHKYASQMRILL